MQVRSGKDVEDGWERKTEEVANCCATALHIFIASCAGIDAYQDVGGFLPEKAAHGDIELVGVVAGVQAGAALEEVPHNAVGIRTFENDLLEYYLVRAGACGKGEGNFGGRACSISLALETLLRTMRRLLGEACDDDEQLNVPAAAVDIAD